jgi:hypothetical protein
MAIPLNAGGLLLTRTLSEDWELSPSLSVAVTVQLTTWVGWMMDGSRVMEERVPSWVEVLSLRHT